MVGFLGPGLDNFWAFGLGPVQLYSWVTQSVEQSAKAKFICCILHFSFFDNATFGLKMSNVKTIFFLGNYWLCEYAIGILIGGTRCTLDNCHSSPFCLNMQLLSCVRVLLGVILINLPPYNWPMAKMSPDCLQTFHAYLVTISKPKMIVLYSRNTAVILKFQKLLGQ